MKVVVMSKRTFLSFSFILLSVVSVLFTQTVWADELATLITAETKHKTQKKKLRSIGAGGPADEVPPAVCECPGIATEDDCGECDKQTDCVAKPCWVVEDGLIQMARCEWVQKERCGQCKKKRGWIIVRQCPETEDVGRCQFYKCARVKIGYSGPLRPSRSVKFSGCKR